MSVIAWFQQSGPRLTGSGIKTHAGEVASRVLLFFLQSVAQADAFGSGAGFWK